MENYYKKNIYEIVNTSLMLSLVLTIKIISSFYPILNGYSIDLYTIPFVFGFLIIRSKIIRMFFYLIVPGLLLIDPNFYFIHPTQFFIEYFLAIYCFFPCFFFFEIEKMIFFKQYKKNEILKFFIFISLFILSWIIKLFLHVLAGKLFWLSDQNWLTSFIFNIEIIGVNILITLPLFTILLPKIRKIILLSIKF
ncbi:MAG: energy-coupled thiamine transporter ThiT [Metamycoplasmataceae bacterium]